MTPRRSGLTRGLIGNRTLRPFLLLLAIIVAIALLDGRGGRFLTAATAFSVLQQFATVGPIALGLGLTMVIREFDLSIGGMMSLSGCIAVLTGVQAPALGILAAMAAGGFAGVCQGAIMVRLRLGSIGVTLGGLLTMGGLAYVVTGNVSIAYPRMDVAMAVNHPVLAVLSLRSLVTLAVFLAAAVVMARTRIGRDIYAVGSDRRAAMVAGVPVDAIVIGVFATSGMLSALGGSLLSYSLATASGVALTDALVPATAAAIVGGISLSGGKGTPLGIVGGVLVLSVLRAGLSAIGTQPSVQDIVTGAVLLIVALADAPDLGRRLHGLRAR